MQADQHVVPDATPTIARHSFAEDVVALVSGTLITAFGLYLIKSSGAVTGGTAGLVLLISQLTSWPFGLLFTAVNLPFAVLGWKRRGPRFVASSVFSVLMLSGFSLLQPRLMTLDQVNPVYAALLGNLAAGIGLLIILRHHSSLGGFNVIAIVCQDRFGWRAGYVLLALDATVIVLSAFTAPPSTVLLSAAGVAVLNLVLVVNHRPGRYPAAL
ncbi:YitT family protein [Actinoplanes sp. NBRC 101535]|uniref:YitT family protein n=1 Tax=Actinoplanes sp. NBRC 101535 TaxID=3032196 RepID=UPI0024A14BFA|nr:YitT family protein [Actinoplanes sp. NBRC 101535]GLY03887.1 membrane protein [Actinoplanes sp. NBRC 101535]